MKMILLFTSPQTILGVYDFLLSDEFSRSYIKNGPGSSKLDFLQEAFIHPPWAMWCTFFYGFTLFILRVLDCVTETPADCNDRA